MGRDIHQIQEAAAQSVGGLLAEAYELGREAGKQEATTQLMARFQEFILQSAPDQDADIAQRTAEISRHESDEPEERAAPGTVKPVIHSLVMSAKDGISMDDIEERTGFKANTVRGTLYGLKRDGVVDRRGNLWFSAISPTNANNESAPPVPDQDPFAPFVRRF